MTKPEYNVLDRVRVLGYENPPQYGTVVCISAIGGNLRVTVDCDPSKYFLGNLGYGLEQCRWELGSSASQFELAKDEGQ